VQDRLLPLFKYKIGTPCREEGIRAKDRGRRKETKTSCETRTIEQRIQAHRFQQWRCSCCPEEL